MKSVKLNEKTKSTILGQKFPIFWSFNKGGMISAQMTRKAKLIDHPVEIKEKIMLPFADTLTAEIQSIFCPTNSILDAFNTFNSLNMQPSLNYDRQLITMLLLRNC